MADENLKEDIDEPVEDTIENTTEEAVEEPDVEVMEEDAGQDEEVEDLETTTDECEEGKETKKGFFSKKKDKKDKKDIQIEELTDKLRRQMAEFDNFRKRTEKEKSTMYEIGAKSVIEKILPIVDNFERGLCAVPEEQKADPFAEGMEKIYKQLFSTLEELDVKVIEAVGQEFDPNFHNAVMHVEDEEMEDNMVTEEFQKGYIYRDSVVRHSMVKVAN